MTMKKRKEAEKLAEELAEKKANEKPKEVRVQQLNVEVKSNEQYFRDHYYN